MAKQAPAKFDLSAVEMVEAELPKQTRTSRFENTPFLDALRNSYERDTAFAFNVPVDAVKETVSLIRGAAAHLEIGVKIRQTKVDDEVTRITFQGAPKRGYERADA